MQPAANVGFHMRCHHLGSKTLSDTNAMQRGTSSSRRVDNASSVRRVVASSSRHESHVAAWASACARAFESSSPSAYPFQSIFEQLMTHLVKDSALTLFSADRAQYTNAI